MCKINVPAVRRYLLTAGAEADAKPKHKDGRCYGETRRELLEGLMKNTAGEGTIEVEYSFSGLGAQLVTAGHVILSREYAVRRWGDPFRLPRALRAVAFQEPGYRKRFR